MTKTILNLIDTAILPAITIVAAKIVGIVLVNRLFNLSWSLTENGLVYASHQDLVLANSYSGLFTYAVVLVGLLWVLIRSQFFHDTHITPKLSAKLFSTGFAHLAGETYEIYSAAVIWLSYTWLVFLVIALQAYFGIAALWSAAVCFGINFVLSIVFAVDVEREMLATRSGHVVAQEEKTLVLEV